jgi:hypothetical protein
VKNPKENVDNIKMGLKEIGCEMWTGLFWLLI